MNISNLVSGAKSYIYHWKKRDEEAKEINPMLNVHLLRGSALHNYLTAKLRDWGKHELRWRIPYEWKDGKKSISLIGHYDNIIENVVLVELKTTNQEDIYKFGLVARAKRQVGAYAEILFRTTGKKYEAFVAVLNSQLTILKLTPEESLEGFKFVKRTAIEVAKEFDQE